MALPAIVLLMFLVGSKGIDRAESVLDKQKRHFVDEHSADLDHEAFLGKDHAHDFDELTADESKARLAALLPKVDADSDGDIDIDELQRWIKVQIMDYVERDAQKALPQEDTNKDGIVSWDEYIVNTFGEQYLSAANGNLDHVKNDDEDDDIDDDDDDDEDDVDDDLDPDHYLLYIKRDKMRFNLADEDDDMKLNFQEFQAFLHPEEFGHMADVVVEETLEDMDEDKDGKISLNEYVGDFIDGDDEEDQDWVDREKKNFKEIKDVNKDGYLDREELAAWVGPQESSYSLEEARHLIDKADANKDGVLSYQEVLESHDLFVGSQVTDFGRILHEEL